MNQNKERKTMECFKWFILMIITLVFLAGPSLAVAKEYKGKAVIPYKSSAFSSKPSDEIKHKAIEKAKISAWKNYTASFSMARQKDYKNINPVKKVVYFTNSRGVLVPQETVRTQVINTNLNHYRKVKKGGI